MATPSKRKQQSISIETKRKIIDESEAGKSYGKLAREYELPWSTVQTIVENKAKILEAIDSGIEPKRARLTTAKNPELEASDEIQIDDVSDEDLASYWSILREHSEIPSDCELSDYLDVDNDVVTGNILTLEEIAQAASSSNVNEVVLDDDDDEDTEPFFEYVN
uniref:HTH psq-type domain-containing protein n=1 Tax=Acrobeloides nanus TaxID=290746 RepID=A0A914CFI3_9BILA